MILSFSREVFKERILSGVKKTSIRADVRRRWKMQNKIHFWLGNPRNVAHNPHEFAFSYVEQIDEVEIVPNGVICDGVLDVFVNGREVQGEELKAFITKEGFDSEEDFKSFFKERFRGVLITWACIRPTQKGGQDV